MIEQCLNCTRKHLALAGVLLTEAHMGYPENADDAIGQMAAAEDHTIQDYPHIAHQIRQERLKYEESLDEGTVYWPAIRDLLKLIRQTKKDEEELDDGESSERSSTSSTGEG